MEVVGLTIKLAAHETNPRGFAVESHEDGQVATDTRRELVSTQVIAVLLGYVFVTHTTLEAVVDIAPINVLYAMVRIRSLAELRWTPWKLYSAVWKCGFTVSSCIIPRYR